MSTPLERLYHDSVSPISTDDLGKGSRLLVPVGAAFGAPQLVREGTFWDWVRKEPDRYWIAGDRTSTHAGVDLGFFMCRGNVYPLPESIPVRASLGGTVQWTGRRSDPESRYGVVLRHSRDTKTFLYTHYADVAQCVRPGQRVKQGQVIGHARRFSDEHPVVLVHFGMGVYVRGWGTDPMDPSFLLRRWRVRHPVEPASTCTGDTLNARRSGRWIAPANIQGLEPVARVASSWKDVYR